MSYSWKGVSLLVQGNFVALKWILLIVLMYCFGLQSFCCCVQIRSFGLVVCNRSLFLVYAHVVNDPHYWVPLKFVTLLSHSLHNILSLLLVMLSVSLAGQKRRNGQWWQSLFGFSGVTVWWYLGLQWNTHFSVSWEGSSLWWLDNPVAVGRGCALQQSLTTRRSAVGVWSTVQKGWRDLLENQGDKRFEHLSLLQWYWRDLSRNIQLPVQLRFNPGEFTVFLSSL